MDIFDYNFYLNLYPDLVVNNIDTYQKAFEHYKDFGFNEGRIKNLKEFLSKTRYNSEIYRYNNDDLHELSDNDLLNHYINHGFYEGRNCSVCNDKIIDGKIFNLNYYRENNDDLNHLNLEQLFDHYINIGKNENRISDFKIYNKDHKDLLIQNNYNPNIYIKKYSDLKIFNFEELENHFINHGLNEGRNCLENIKVDENINSENRNENRNENDSENDSENIIENRNENIEISNLNDKPKPKNQKTKSSYLIINDLKIDKEEFADIHRNYVNKLLINDSDYFLDQFNFLKNRFAELKISFVYSIEDFINKFKDFNFDKYQKKNKLVNLKSKLDIVYDYIYFGIKENLNFKKKTFYIISNILGRGSNKFLEDLKNTFKNINFAYIRNINHLYKIPDNSNLIIQYFMYTDINIRNFIKLTKIKNFKYYIFFHDFYFFNQDEFIYEYSNNCYLNYTKKSDSFKINKYILFLLENAIKLISPSKFVYNIFNNFVNKEILIVNHIDYKLTNKIRKNIIHDNTINLGIIHEMTECKGKEIYDKIIENFNNKLIYDHKVIFKILGVDINYYNDNILNFYKIITDHNLHGFLFLNKYGETFCYTLTKALHTGLPILYNNIGSYQDRINREEHKILCHCESEINEYLNNINDDKIHKNFVNFIENLIINNKDDSIEIINEKNINTDKFIDKFYKNMFM